MLLILSSNLLINNHKFLMAYPPLDKISFDELSKYVVPIQGRGNGLGIPLLDSDHNLDVLKSKLCDGTQDNRADNRLGIPLLCNPSEGFEDKSAENQFNGHSSNKLDEKMEKLKEKLDSSIFNDNKNKNSTFNDNKNKNSKSDRTQLNPEAKDEGKQLKENNNDNNQNDHKNNDKNQGNNNNDDKQLNNNDDKQLNNNEDGQGNHNDNNNERYYNDNNNNNQGKKNEKNNEKKQGNDNGNNGLGIAGLDLNISKKLADVDDKINNLKNKVTKENNNLLFAQQEDNKAKENNLKNQNKNNGNNEIGSLNLNILNVKANLEKKIEKLKDKIENDKDNQRLVENRHENEAKDNDKNSDDTKAGDGETYEGYRFNGGGDDGKQNGNDDNNFNFAAAGDYGCSTNTQNTVSNMESKDPELILALGDLSYHSTADCWFDIMSPLKGKMMITLGYHDIKDGASKMNQYVKTFELNNPYYSYDYKHVHFLVMASLSDYKEGSEQYNFIKQDLKKASQNKDTNWIIVSTYKPLYSSPSEHPADDSLRDTYNPLFEKYGVDLVLNGHNHNYQRTYPLTYNPNESAKPITTSELGTGYNKGNGGIVFATVGTGGENFYSLEGKNPYVANQFAGKFGFLEIDISNTNPHAKLTGTFYDNKGSKIQDEFTIEKDIKDKKSDLSYS
jgi:hypothetical protein